MTEECTEFSILSFFLKTIKAFLLYFVNKSQYNVLFLLTYDYVCTNLFYYINFKRLA